MRPSAAVAFSLLLATQLFGQTDVRVSSTKLEHSIYAGDFMALDVNIRNMGPGDAAGVILSIDFPPEVVFDRFFDSDEDCDTTRKPIRCTIGTLESGRHRDVMVRTIAPQTAGTFPLSVTATFNGTDRDPSNNSLTARYTTTLTTAMYASLDTYNYRAQPGAVVTTPVAVYSNLNVFDPGNIRLHIESTGAPLELEPAFDWSCTITGNSAVCAVPRLNPSCHCSSTGKIIQRVSADRAGGEAKLTAWVRSDLPNLITERFTKAIQIVRVLAVTTTADDGPGSLRQAIHDVNATCGEHPCRIAFEIPPPVPAEGWFTIIPATPLPHITAKRVALDGLHQTTFSGDTNPAGPEIAIDGRLAGEGLVILSDCEAVVRGFAIGNFMENYGLWYGTDVRTRNDRCGFGWTLYDQNVVARNHIGVDPTGTVAWPNLRGLRADNAFGTISENIISGNRYSGIWAWRGALSILDNRIGTAADGVTPLPNGASGILLGPEISRAQVLGNTIAYHRDMGVAVVRGATWTEIRENSMFGNAGLGIDWGLDGRDAVTPVPPSPGVPAPTLLSAVYDAAKNETVVTGTATADPRAYYVIIDVYGNDVADDDGKQWLGSSGLYAEDTFRVIIAGDHRGKWLNATAMRYIPVFSKTGNGQVFGMDERTSELGNSVKVE